MGISASQARFLGLTGQKNDIEFQGQQINQERMSLANTSSAITTAANAMPVPIVTDFASVAEYLAEVAKYNQEYEERMTTELAPLQLQDKKLELQLKALDTEQQAIQTELEAVAKVIDKNVEGSFKTFG